MTGGGGSPTEENADSHVSMGAQERFGVSESCIIAGNQWEHTVKTFKRSVLATEGVNTIAAIVRSQTEKTHSGILNRPQAVLHVNTQHEQLTQAQLSSIILCDDRCKWVYVDV